MPGKTVVRPRPTRAAGGRKLAAGVAVLLTLLVAACGPGGPTLDPSAQAGRVEATAISGRFQLSFAVDEGIVRADQVITGTATLNLLVPGGADLSGSSSLFGFEFLEVGGQGRHVAPVWDAMCAPHRLTANTPLTSPILKSGAATDQFTADFLRGTEVRLPRGAWDITAIAMFVDGKGCSGVRHDMRATVRVHVRE